VNAVAYLRVSTDDQARHGLSLGDQRARTTAWCTAHGHILMETLDDAGVSGKDVIHRPRCQAAIALAEKHNAVLVVCNLSRLGRRLKDLIAIKDRLHSTGAFLAIIELGMDTSTPTGELLFNVLGAVYQFQREELAAQAKALSLRLQAGGKRMSDRPPYGWVRDPDDDTRLVADLDQQAIIGEIHAWREQGLSYRRIAGMLNAQGVPSATDSPAGWGHQAVAAILKRPHP
jgi:site-specific DNA recombinase